MVADVSTVILLCWDHYAFILQATQSSCQNSQFPVHLARPGKLSQRTDDQQVLLATKKLTAATLLMDTGRQQAVRILINGSVWQAQVEELLMVITVTQSCLKDCKTVIWKTKGRINPKTKDCIHYRTHHWSQL